MCVKKQNGFTLVEIMIVVAIVGLLASIGTLAIMKSVNNARIKTAESELQILSVAVLQLAWDTGKWPNKVWRNQSSSGIIHDLASVSAGLMQVNTNDYVDWKGPYYEGTLQDPWRNRYFFDPAYSIEGVPAIVVGSKGSNGIFGEKDIIVRLDE